MAIPKLVLIGDTLVTLYENMVRIRQFAEALAPAIEEGEADGAAWPKVGLEAVAVGVNYHLGPTDLVFASRPAMGVALSKGVGMEQLACQWMWKATGCGGGVGGGRAFAAPSAGLLAVMQDTTAPLLNALGAAAANLPPDTEEDASTGPPPLAVGFFGANCLVDGTLHESLLCAGEWELPVLFVGQIDASRGLFLKRWATIAKNYGMAAVHADGRSVSDVYAAANEAVRRARAEEGASLLLFDVAVADAGEALSDEDDPILVMQKQLLRDNSVSEDELDEIHERSAQAAASAIQSARSAPDVDWDAASKFVDG